MIGGLKVESEGVWDEMEISPDSESVFSESDVLAGEKDLDAVGGAEWTVSGPQEAGNGSLQGSVLEDVKKAVEDVQGPQEAQEGQDTHEELREGQEEQGSMTESLEVYQDAVFSYQDGMLSFSVFLSVALGVLVGCVLVKTLAVFFR